VVEDPHAVGWRSGKDLSWLLWLSLVMVRSPVHDYSPAVRHICRLGYRTRVGRGRDVAEMYHPSRAAFIV
jgi:hypothetical protein